MVQEDPGRGQERGERDAEMYRLSVLGWPQWRIAEKYGIAQQRVSFILRDFKRTLPALDKAQLVRDSTERLMGLIERVAELVEMEGAPVTAGKDGDVVYDPVSKQVVRDYSGRATAIELLRKLDESVRKLHGLDAASKVESTATVRYEVVGVDTEDLR